MNFDDKEDKVGNLPAHYNHINFQGKCIEVEGSKFGREKQENPMMNDDDEDIIAPIEHTYYVIEGNSQSQPAADPAQVEGSGADPLDLRAPLNSTSIHVRASTTSQDGTAVEILTKA